MFYIALLGDLPTKSCTDGFFLIKLVLGVKVRSRPELKAADLGKSQLEIWYVFHF